MDQKYKINTHFWQWVILIWSVKDCKSNQAKGEKKLMSLFLFCKFVFFLRCWRIYRVWLNVLVFTAFEIIKSHRKKLYYDVSTSQQKKEADAQKHTPNDYEMFCAHFHLNVCVRANECVWFIWEDFLLCGVHINRQREGRERSKLLGH